MSLEYELTRMAPSAVGRTKSQRSVFAYDAISTREMGNEKRASVARGSKQACQEGCWHLCGDRKTLETDIEDE